MITEPHWTEKQTEILEYCLDQIRDHNLSKLTFTAIVSEIHSTREIESHFSNEANLNTSFIKYWAWKETWQIDKVLVRIKNPFKRLFTLMKWGFQNNRYIKIYPYLIKMDLPREAQEEIKRVTLRKNDFLVQLFMDRGIPVEKAKLRASSILPYYYGWTQDKEDHIKSDLQKVSLLAIYKTLLFPELFKDKDRGWMKFFLSQNDNKTSIHRKAS